jgi:hypothetical protein
MGVNIPIVVALEGGYNTTVISACMEAVACALLDEDWNDGAKPIYNDAPQDCPKVASENESVGSCLEMGRRVLADYWDYYAENDRQKGKLKISAARDLNRTIRCLRNTPYWIARGIHLEEIPPQVPSGNRVTRSKVKDTANLDEIQFALQSFSL